MKPPLLQVDDLETRRDVWHLLHRLPPGGRVRYLKWCCARVRKAHGKAPAACVSRELVRLAGRDDTADRRLTNTVYGDYLVLAAQWDLDALAAAVELERRVRRPGAASASSSRPCAP